MSTKTQISQHSPRLYTYIIQCDNGGAPCAENSLWSLAICKPGIRKGARVGDTIVGIGGEALKLKTETKQILFISIVTKVITMEKYAIDYANRPDSIYTPDLKLKPNKFHDCGNIETDLKGKNVVISAYFIYFGNKHISVPHNLQEIIPGRAYKYNPNASFKPNMASLFNKCKKTIGFGKIGQYNNKKKTRCNQ